MTPIVILSVAYEIIWEFYCSQVIKIILLYFFCQCRIGLVTAIATVIATLGQMYCLPSRASLIFSLESVVCAILSLIILREALDISEVYGLFRI